MIINFDGGRWEVVTQREDGETVVWIENLETNEIMDLEDLPWELQEQVINYVNYENESEFDDFGSEWPETGDV